MDSVLQILGFIVVSIVLVIGGTLGVFAFLRDRKRARSLEDDTDSLNLDADSPVIDLSRAGFQAEQETETPSAGVEKIGEDEEEEECFPIDESMPAYAARAAVPASTEPLFIPKTEVFDERTEEVPLSAEVESTKEIAERRRIYKGEQEIEQDEPALSEEVTGRISKLGTDLDEIEALVAGIEESLAGFEPLAGIELDSVEEPAPVAA
ncbi:MAG: hypothetical protein HKN23_06130 [Verrucomicrobiales bacterium]|nr:hypothetical protein [Verrucomicrobiales bacterium]